jgi:sugar transferase (PEP-CTERM/EpsH1 system associated)
MRILFLAHRFPYPPTFGSKVRAFNMIRHLAQAHEVTVMAPARSAAEADEARGIAAHCASYEAFPVAGWAQLVKVGITLPTVVSASEAYFHSGAMKAAIARRVAAGAADMIVVHCSSVGRLVEDLPLPKLIDFCDVDSRKWLDYTAFKPFPLSAGYRWEGWRMTAAERRLARKFDAVTVATAGELATMRDLGMAARADWFPNGVDTEYFTPGTEPFEPETISFVGRMDYFPNERCMVDFCRDVWPRLRARRAGVRLQIVGAAPTPAVQALARIDGVTVTGAVPDVRPFVRRSALTIAPLSIARGTQNKVLESMAMGVPVVCSPLAAAGVEAEPGVHLRVARSAEDWVNEVERLLADPAQRAALAEAGRARVFSHHTWPRAMQRLDAIVARCMQAHVQSSAAGVQAA